MTGQKVRSRLDTNKLEWPFYSHLPPEGLECIFMHSGENRLALEWSSNEVKVKSIYRQLWILVTIGCVISTAFILGPWVPIHGNVRITLLAGLIGCLVIILLKNAEATHYQTGEDKIYIHLITSLFLLITSPIPFLGSIISLGLSIRLFRGRYKWSGGLSIYHQVGKTGVPLGLMLVVWSFVLFIAWANIFIVG